MHVVVCGSMTSSEKMVEIKNELESLGHSALLPMHTEAYANKEKTEESDEESAENKIEGDLIRDYYKKIEDADVVLIVNEKKNGVEGYVGGNTFLEMGFGHVLNKKVYMLNEIPDVSYTSEIVAMQPIVLDGDLTKFENQ